MMITLSTLLDRREERSMERKKLIEKYQNILISFHLNIPGNIKDKLLYKITLIEGQDKLIDFLKRRQIRLTFDNIEFYSTGPESVLMVDGHIKEIKRLMVEFEESHPLGRLFDLDVYDLEGIPISRQSLGLEERRCYVCDDLAKVCARSRRHDIDQLILSLEDQMTKFHITESHREV